MQRTVKLNTFSEKDVNDLMNHLAENVIKKPMSAIRRELDIPEKQKFNMTHAVHAFRKYSINYEVRVTYNVEEKSDNDDVVLPSKETLESMPLSSTDAVIKDEIGKIPDVFKPVQENVVNEKKDVITATSLPPVPKFFGG